MKLPETVLTARERMAKADAALHAGIENDAPVDKISHKLDELHLSFMNKFRKLGFIHYDGKLQVHSSLLNVVLHD